MQNLALGHGRVSSNGLEWFQDYAFSIKKWHVPGSSLDIGVTESCLAGSDQQDR